MRSNNTENAENADIKVVFIHIPKTAGTSIIQALSASVPKNKISPLHFSHEFERAEESQKYKAKLFTGHFPTYYANQIPEPRFEFTFLRDPRKRIISQFNFWRSHSIEQIERKGLHHLKKYKYMSLKDCIMSEAPEVQSVMKNYSSQFFQDRRLAEANKLLNSSPSQDSIRFTTNRLKKLAFIGFVEDMDFCYSTLRDLIPLDLPKSVSKHRTLESTELSLGHEKVPFEPIDAEMKSRLDELTIIDRAVYNEAAKYAFKRGWTSKLIEIEPFNPSTSKRVWQGVRKVLPFHHSPDMYSKI